MRPWAFLRHHLILSFLAVVIHNESVMAREQFDERLKWFEPSQGQVSQVALVLHGLNNKPTVMDDLAQFLAARNVASLRATLSGHAGEMEEFKKATRAVWKADVKQAYEIARARAFSLDVPLILAGFSLGALIASDLVTEGEARFDRLLLFAPAFTPNRSLQRFISIGKPFSGLVVPSFAPESFRAHSGTPVSAYVALFESARALEEKRYSKLKVPALVIMDREDELVSHAALEEAIRKHKLAGWVTEYVATAASEPGKKRFHHLVVNEYGMGSGWAAIQARVAQWLESGS